MPCGCAPPLARGRTVPGRLDAMLADASLWPPQWLLGLQLKEEMGCWRKQGLVLAGVISWGKAGVLWGFCGYFTTERS